MPKATIHHQDRVDGFTLIRVEGQHGLRYFDGGWSVPEIARKLADEGIDCSRFYCAMKRAA